MKKYLIIESEVIELVETLIQKYDIDSFELHEVFANFLKSKKPVEIIADIQIGTIIFIPKEE